MSTYMDRCRHIHAYTLAHAYLQMYTYEAQKIYNVEFNSIEMTSIVCHFKSIIIIHKMMVVDSDDKHN